MLKNLSIRLLSYGFRSCALLLAVAGTLVISFSSPQHIKQAFQDSHIYDTLIDSLAQQAQQDSAQSQSQDTLPLNQPEVRDALHTAVSPAMAQISVEQLLDGTYHWLNGTTATPDFRIDLRPALQTFGQALGSEGVQHAQSLPLCTAAQLQQIDLQTADLLSLPCLPPGLNLTQAQQQMIDTILSQNELLKQPVLTAATLPKDPAGQTVFQKASAAPKVYHWLMLSPWLLGLLMIVFGAGVFWTRRNWRATVGSLGASLLGVGVLLLISGGVSAYLIGAASKSHSLFSNLGDTALQHTIVQFVSSLSHTIILSLCIFGGTYVVLGAAGILAVKLTKPTRPDNTTNTDQTNQAEILASKPGTTDSTNVTHESLSDDTKSSNNH